MSLAELQRLLVPKTIALIGSGTWTDAVAAGAMTLGYPGEVWRIHPSRTSTAQTRYFRSIDELPAAPDATFIAVPNLEVPAVAKALAERGAGGFVCFSAGFSETGTVVGQQLTHELIAAAGSLPYIGPNCYGMVNFFDRVALWPDQVVGAHVERGVAIICQSGTIALTMMFNDRSLPIGYLITIGNQTRLPAEDLIDALCDDPRVTAFGLYLEGIRDAERFARAADKARACGKPIALVKSGRTAAAARTAHSHTGALAGSDAVFDAFCREAGIARCDTLGTLCETLKVLHNGGPLRGRRVIVMGASGGDMAMTADVARDLGLRFPEFPRDATQRLNTLLSDRVTVANPFDIHTYLWFDHPALRRLFTEVLSAEVDAVGFSLDCPPEGTADLSAFTPVIAEFVAAARDMQPRAALISSLPETPSPAIRAMCMDGGVVPLQGQREALEALDHAGAIGEAWQRAQFPVLQRPPEPLGAGVAMSEHAGKAALAAFGLPVPLSRVVACPQAATVAAEIGFPVVMKASAAHLEHKSELGGVVLGIKTSEQAASAVQTLAQLSDQVLVEQMIDDGVAEILVGITVDAQFGQVLVIGAGGVQTELWQDSVSLLPPWSAAQVARALSQLKVARLLDGFRGKPSGDTPALIDAILAIGRYATAHCATLIELDVNPIIVRPRGVIAVDALIRQSKEL
jgi:acetyl-CoA synthetase